MSKEDLALEDLARFVQVIGSDLSLREWFVGLCRLPSLQRQSDIYAMVEQMKKQGEDPDLIALFALLSEESVFEAACAALRESGYMEK